MNKRYLYGAATALLLMGSSPAVFAQESNAEAPMPGTAQTIDAASIVGQDLHDTEGNDIGDIDAVLVDAEGMVQSVVADVSGWLEGEKLINLQWSDLAQGPDGEIIATNLTKEQAESNEGYAYNGDTQGGVLLEDGQPYRGMAATDGATGSDTDATAGVAGSATGTADGVPAGESTENNTAETNTGMTDNNTGMTDNNTGMTDNNTGMAENAAGDPDAIMNSDGSVNTSNVVGAAVENATGDKLGEVNEVVLLPDGDIQGVVVDVGGLLGMGAHSVLLDWEQIELIQRDGREVLTVNATEDSLKQLPEYQAPAN